jgi:Domain of unknown function (DUF4288)
MNWYMAKCVYQVITGCGNHKPQFDEQWRLIRADEFAWALEKATILGRLGECSFVNSKMETVNWKFINVVDVYPITSLQDGEEIYASTEEPKDADDYLDMIQAKAERLAHCA